jgi:hypothetical protein
MAEKFADIQHFQGVTIAKELHTPLKDIESLDYFLMFNTYSP